VKTPEGHRLVPKQILADRLLDAPRELVWRVWTDLSHLAEWWGPRGFTTTTTRGAVETGGEWHFTMHGPDGRDYENHVEFVEVEKPSRLRYRQGGGGETAAIRFEVEVRFLEEGGRTRLTMTMTFPSDEARDHVIANYGALEGLEGHLARLAEHLVLQDPFTIVRAFDAPLELVWKAHTQADRLAKWWGVKGMATTVKRFELAPGGLFVYGMRSPAGQEMWGRFTYREILPMKRLVYVSSFSDPEGRLTRAPFFEDWPLEVLNVLTFEETGGRTTLTLRGGPLHANEAELARYRAMHESMNGGFNATYDQLAAYLQAG
jgi:uncharacterized protein YndB with AHSA1/START domain